jgi:hypothetical protein
MQVATVDPGSGVQLFVPAGQSFTDVHPIVHVCVVGLQNMSAGRLFT